MEDFLKKLAQKSQAPDLEHIDVRDRVLNTIRHQEMSTAPSSRFDFTSTWWFALGTCVAAGFIALLGFSQWLESFDPWISYLLL